MKTLHLFFISFALIISACNNAGQTDKAQTDSKAPVTESPKEKEVPKAKPQRIIQMEGAANFRDLGGYVGKNGKNVQWGKLYRSDKLSELTKNDVEKIDSIGIKTVVDLRSEMEVLREPDVLPEGVKSIRIPMWREAWNVFFEMYKDGNIDSAQLKKNRAKIDQMVADSYSEFPLEFKKQTAEFMHLLSDSSNYPILFHCTAGTDRTGYLGALTLDHLGVDHEVILSDYSMSAKLRLDEEGDDRILATMEKIKELGGIEAYLSTLQSEKAFDVKAIENNLLQ